MSEIADELERMAREVEQTAKGRARAAEKFKGTDRGLRLLSESNGLYEASRALLHRAAELRAQALRQRSPWPYKPQQKPEHVDKGQWWAQAHLEPDLVVSTWPDGHDRWASFSSRGPNRPDEMTRIMLYSDEWLYLGDGPEPARR